MTDPDMVLDVRNLTVDYITERGKARAVDNVSLRIHAGEVYGLAGESGSGKSTAALSVLRLLGPPAMISGGEVWFQGTNLLALDESSLREVRWRDISMVFQSAMNALNPVMRIGPQVRDVILRHTDTSRPDADRRVKEVLQLVGIDPTRARAYPHELSGGMRQRVMIAIALALQPSLIIMDEPTTALDVVVQREILDEIRILQATLGFAILFITHDMSLLIELSDRIAIMYAGRIVEEAAARDIYEQPQHPYTQGLMRSFPSLDGEVQRLSGIPGTAPGLLNLPGGCPFHDRCPSAMPVCAVERPPVVTIGAGHTAACHLLAAHPATRLEVAP